MKCLKGVIVILSLLLTVSSLQAQSFQDFLEELYALPDSLRPALVDSFMNANEQFPLLEADTLAHFIYNSGVSSIAVPGDFNNLNSNTDYMTLVTGSNFHYLTKTFETDARLDYKFVVGGSNWILDPLNPKTCPGGFGANSELAMPMYIYPPEVLYYSGIPHGTIEDTSFYSQNLGNSRTVKIYTPPGYQQSTDDYPYIIFHDGLEYLSLANAKNTLDYCIHHGLCVPLIAVFVPPVNRTEEYVTSLQDEFTAFIITELIPYIDGSFRTITDAGARAIMGPSYGGNISLHLAVTHPEIIGMTGPQSSYVESSILQTLSEGPALNLDFYLDAGTYEPGIINPLEEN